MTLVRGRFTATLLPTPDANADSKTSKGHVGLQVMLHARSPSPLVYQIHLARQNTGPQKAK